MRSTERRRAEFEAAAACKPGLPGATRVLFAVYKSVVSPMVHAVSPSQCIFLPTCSEYAYVAFSRFGAVQGSCLALRRLLRCHPFSKGGVDPVPAVPARPDRLP